MADSTALPTGWARDFEGTVSAVYRREPTGIEVIIEPRYTLDKRQKNTPTRYRIRLKRPFWYGRGDHIETPLETVDTFDEARTRAFEYMETYNQRYRQANDRGTVIRQPDGTRDTPLTATAAATQAAADTTETSMDQVIQHLRTLVDDGLCAVWDARDDTVEVHYTADTFDQEQVAPINTALATFDEASIAEELDTGVRSIAVTVDNYVLYRFAPDDAPKTVVVIDETSYRVEPNFTRETAALLADRER
jgi:ADP-ribose pyrophosphatase YjhB (NUDIX family)